MGPVAGEHGGVPGGLPVAFMGVVDFRRRELVEIGREHRDAEANFSVSLVRNQVVQVHAKHLAEPAQGRRAPVASWGSRSRSALMRS